MCKGHQALRIPGEPRVAVLQLATAKTRSSNGCDIPWVRGAGDELRRECPLHVLVVARTLSVRNWARAERQLRSQKDAILATQLLRDASQMQPSVQVQ